MFFSFFPEEINKKEQDIIFFSRNKEEKARFF